MKKHVLIIGAGGVAKVVAHKCAQNNDILGDIHIASRTLEKCEAIVASIRERNALNIEGRLEAHQLDHGRYFATNFDPEINFREFTGQVWSWQDGKWTSNSMFEVGHEWELPVVGRQRAYLTGHDEVHSLSQILGVPNVRFWMGFGDHYINVFNVLKNLGLLSEKPVTTAEGVDVVPLKVVKAVLPDPSSLADGYTGKTCIGTLAKGVKDDRAREIFIYNVADHEEACEEVGSQASRTRPEFPLSPRLSLSLRAAGTSAGWRTWRNCRRGRSSVSSESSDCPRISAKAATTGSCCFHDSCGGAPGSPSARRPRRQRDEGGSASAP